MMDPTGRLGSTAIAKQICICIYTSYTYICIHTYIYTYVYTHICIHARINTKADAPVFILRT